ncbi:MAG: SLC13 family permease, partial [Planctomycetota bacterium]
PGLRRGVARKPRLPGSPPTLRPAPSLRTVGVVEPGTLTLLALGMIFVGALLPGVGLDLVAILSLVVLVVGGVINPAEAASGFGNTTLLTVACMFILAEALQRTGAVERVGRMARHLGRKGPRRLLLGLLPVVVVLSALMNNTSVVVLLLPVLLAVSQELDIPPSRLLIPLSYAAILGGTLTLVGTTTNLLVDGLVRENGEAGFALLDFFPMGVAFTLIGLTYMVIFGPRLLPDRVGLTTIVARNLRSDYLTEVVLGPRAPLVGRTLDGFPHLTERIRFLQIVRGEETLWPPFHDIVLQESDLLMVKGPPDDIVRLLQQRGLSGPPEPEGGGRVAGVTLDLAEVVVAPGSRLDGATVRAAGLRQRFGVTVLAVLRRGAHLREHLGSLALRMGDTLLVQGEERDLARLARSDDLILVGGPPPRALRTTKAALAIGVSLGALFLAAAGVLALPIAALLACVALVGGGCLSSGEAYRAINLRIIVILGCMLAVGLAVSRTGIAADVATTLVHVGGQWGARGVLAAVYLATLLLTEVVTNAGTAAVMVPIAIQVSRIEGVSSTPLVMAVALAASCSLLTPIGYQTNLLVYGPGGYRFFDYARVGLPLALILWVTAVLLLPVVFPF